ncbi:hypothetical protein QVD17_14131 [Tagetes erecta]|uniref:Uncharacterized protein n=1 Tax=Tagetes erecta TaxID=13708 RepID=A0AAD8KXI9_TARER|nr:hypothetical protein QVD17_14131 [Tagetes erecta]
MKHKMNGGGGEKRKTNESEEKNNKRPYRGTGVEQLERLRLQQKITHPHQPPPHYFPLIYPPSSFNTHNYFPHYAPAPPILSSIPNYSATHHSQKMGIYGGSKVIEVPKLRWNGLFVETIGVGNSTSTLQEETGVMPIQRNNAGGGGGGEVKAITIKFGNSKL